MVNSIVWVKNVGDIKIINDIKTIEPKIEIIPQKEIENIMPEVKNYEPRIALTDFEEGLNFYYRIAKVGRTLIPNGIIILEVGLGKHPQKVFSLFKEAGFDQLELIKDYNNNERILKINI